MKLKWNRGAWFGSQLGGSVWILIAAVLAAARDWLTGFMLLAIFAGLNFIGFLFWRRKTLTCYAATQWLIGFMGVAGLLAICVLVRRGLWWEIQIGGAASPEYVISLLLVLVCVLMVTMYLRFGRSSESDTENDG